MYYTIFESHLVYKDEKLTLIAVLWLSNAEGDGVRASYFTDQPVSGYGYLMPGMEVNPKLMQKVAGQGMNLPEHLKKKYFPGKRKWER